MPLQFFSGEVENVFLKMKIDVGKNMTVSNRMKFILHFSLCNKKEL
jgi:hypothetical protein